MTMGEQRNLTEENVEELKKHLEKMQQKNSDLTYRFFPQDEPPQMELDYAKRISTYLWERYYKEVSPDWKPLNTLMGVLAQIDNMIAGIHGPEKEQPERYSKENLYAKDPTKDHTWSCTECGRYLAPEFKASHVCPSTRKEWEEWIGNIPWFYADDVSDGSVVAETWIKEMREWFLTMPIVPKE
jgi:rubrerythrin